MSRDTTKFYRILGVPKESTPEELRKAYRKLAAKLHPDKPGGSQEKFQELQNIYDTLSDADKRQIYDNYGEEGLKKGIVYERHAENFEGPDLFDLFTQGGGFFEFRDGRMFRGRERGRERERQEPRNRIHVILSQLMPIILIVLMYVLPWLLESVNF